MSQENLGDIPGLVESFHRVAGRKFRGAVDCGDCIELVFDDEPHGCNLVSIFLKGPRLGMVAFGGISQDLIDSGYIRP